MSCAVNVICELADKNPKNYLAMAPQFFRLLTTSSNNWMLIKVGRRKGRGGDSGFGGFGGACERFPRAREVFIQAMSALGAASLLRRGSVSGARSVVGTHPRQRHQEQQQQQQRYSCGCRTVDCTYLHIFLLAPHWFAHFLFQLVG